MNVVASYSGSENVATHFTYGLGLVNQVNDNGDVGYYDFSLTGNTIGITGGSGQYLDRYSYLPFGQTSEISQSLVNPFTFCGQLGVTERDNNLWFIRVSCGWFLSAQLPISSETAR